MRHFTKTPWKKWCRKLVLFFAIFASLDYAVGLIYSCVLNEAIDYNPTDTYIKSVYTVNHLSTDIVIIGDSKVSRHYIPQIFNQKMGMSVYNCGEDGAFLIYQVCIIKLMLSRYTPQIILWDLGMNCYSSDVEEYNYFNKLYPFYNRNECKQVVDYISWNQHIKMLSKMYQNNGNFYDYLIPFIEKSNDVNLGYEALDSMGYIYPQHITINYKNSINQYKRNLFLQMLDLLKNKKVKVIFALSPHFYQTNIRKTKQFKTLVEDIKRRQFIVIDYFDDMHFNDSTLFYDNIHMNGKGAKMYSTMLADTLQNIVQNME